MNSRLSDVLIGLFFPRRCVVCGAVGTWLCTSCGQRLTPLAGPRCRRCGRPLEEPARSCIECRGRDLAFVSAAAAFAYQGPARTLVAACKFRRLRELAEEMAALAAPRFAQLVTSVSQAAPFALLTWVPTTAQRLRERGFDQAALLAGALAARAELPVAPLLIRSRAAGEQSRLGRAARAGNVRGAFTCTHPAPSRPASSRSLGATSGIDLRQKRVLIIDDVYTTGETLNQCARALSGAGYEAHVFTFARTVRGHSQ